MFCLIFSLVTLVSASLLLAWFNSTLKIHLLEFILSFFPSSTEAEAWRATTPTMAAFDDYILFILGRRGKWGEFLGDLLVCPICLSFHIALWVSVVCWAVFPMSILIVPACMLGTPILSNLLYALYRKLTKTI